MKRKKLFFVLFVFSFLLSIVSSNAFARSNGQIVYIVPIKKTVEKGSSAFVSRAISTAEENHAAAIIFEIDTPGGAVDAAIEIGKRISETKIKTISYINQDAISAGSFIALNTDEIYMADGSRIGAAGIIDGAGNAAGEKAQSYWLSAMRGAAEKNGRDPIYALAMADKTTSLPKYGSPNGKYLTLTSSQSLEVGYSEGTVNNLEDLMQKLQLDHAEIIKVKESFADKIARFVTSPYIVPLLITAGCLGVLIELFSPGFGLSGLIGISSFLLFFYGHLVSGLAGYETIFLFVIGIVLLILEFFILGGIAGILGGIAIVASLFLASGNIVQMGISILIAIGVSILASIIMVKVLGKKMKFFKKIILSDSTNTESGYVTNPNRTDLIGKAGTTLTALRPAGTVIIGEERIDVVSEGMFIEKNVKVKVVKAEGSRIVVRQENSEIQKEDK
ncbi:NfeD family protein [Niallia sp. 03133]|uniref:NfeD family protein n=1 Tax=Niallia sp. 03133 TaxID=3458060 RepID=UPI0040439D6C